MIILKSLKHLPAKLYNSETLDYKTRVLANGGTITEATLDAIEKFVQDCKNSLIWDKFLEVAPCAGGNLNAALVKLVYPAGVAGTLTNVNFVAGDYNERGANGGLLGDGSTKYLDTGFNAQSKLPDYAHLSFYLREDAAGATGNRSMLGVVSGTDNFWIGSLTPASDTVTRLGQQMPASYAQSFVKGFYIGSRSSTTLITLYKDGQAVASNAAPVTITRPNLNLHAFAFNFAGAGLAHLPARGSFYSIGQSLTDSEALALHEAVRTLQRNLNREIN